MVTRPTACGRGYTGITITMATENVKRVTPEQIEDTIVTEVYTTADHIYDDAVGLPSSSTRRVERDTGNRLAELSLLTICVLQLKNGFTVVGTSGCADPKMFDVQIGRQIARQNAINQIWPILGYELKQQLTGEVA